MRKIVVQGLGFVGSATAIAVSSKLDKGLNPIFDVHGIDLKTNKGKHRVNQINKGNFPFKTQDNKIIKEAYKAYKRGNLKASHSQSVFAEADVVIISINYDIQNVNQSNNKKDSFRKSCEIVAKNISAKTLVIVQSTVAPGTCEKIVYPIFKKYLKHRNISLNNFWLAHSYERVMPGKNYLDSIINYWRVYSGINDSSAKQCKKFFEKVINTKLFPLTKLETTTASELAKVMENSYRSVNIAFVEEWSRLSEQINVDLYDVINAIRKRPSHSNLMQPGFGVGGYCLTKDPLLAKLSSKKIFKLKGHDFIFSTKSIEINRKMPIVTLNKILNFFNKSLKNKNLLLLGASYREEVADTRFSPSEIFYKKAKKLGANIDVHDPLVHFWDELKINVNNKLPCIKKYHALVFAVKHKNYKKISFKKLLVDKKKILIFDANKVLDLKQIREIKSMKEATFISIGR
tara:strand:- start:8366 stop:9742 length:1377 start_codon:yes stop_codon:yes gene_type:complete